jgi:Tol biopolymer transport system component
VVPIGPRFVLLCLGGVGGALTITLLAFSVGSHAGKRRVSAPTDGTCRTTGSRHIPGRRHGDGGTIAFVRYQGGSYAVFVMRATGGPARRLSVAPSHSFSPQREIFQGTPAWSPDGRRLAFTSTRTGRSGLYVMNADGTGTRRLAPGAGDADRPSWSPEGRQIVFARSRHGHLDVIGSDGRGLRPLTRAQGVADSDPAWSPDGSEIAFVRRPLGSGIAALFLIHADGRGLCRLTPYSRSVYSPSWSPDGTRLTYTNRNGSGFAIDVVDADGRKLRQLTAEGLDFTPSWSADGSKIVFARGATLYVMNADGTRVRRLTHGEIDDSPAWRPA